MMLLFLLATFLTSPRSIAFAEEGTPLDPPYPALTHPTEEGVRVAPPRSDLMATLATQTPVRTQGSRGTCSIFSANALLESMLVIRRGLRTNLDFSEQWLEYQVTRTRAREGSWSPLNFKMLTTAGVPEESYLPYNPAKWENADTGPALEFCGGLGGFNLAACLIGQRDPRLMAASNTQLSDPRSPLYDPDFLAARRRSLQIRGTLLNNVGTGYSVRTVGEAKALLSEGFPITLDIDFYYGAWNHRKAEEIGMSRNMDHWEKGIVGNPEPGSVDLRRSPELPAGHSVLVVGYDDEAQVRIPVLMEDGQYKWFTYKGVYYFKNSWGTEGFGKSFRQGGAPYAGYGMIVQKYAHKYGAFYQLPLR